jgi:hypothetical protein
MSAKRYKKIAKRKHRTRVKSIDDLIREQRAELDPIANARVDNKLVRLGVLDLSTFSTSQPLER